MWNVFDGFGFMWGGICLMMIFPAVVTVLVIVLLIKLIQGKKTTKVEEDFSIKLLRERLAKGEIDEEEFKRKMELLKK